MLVNLANLTGAIHFYNLVVEIDGIRRSFRQPSLEYAIEVSENGFSDHDGRIRGGFFGPAHEDMAGVLDDRTIRLLAGFGGSR